MTIINPENPTGVPLTTFPWRLTPYNNITPFTTRDGETFIDELEAIKTWLADVQTPYINETIANYIAEFNKNRDDYQIVANMYVIAARERGVIGDGIADDTVAINNAIISARDSTLTKKVWLGPGTYSVSNIILLPGVELDLGGGKIVTKANSSNATIVAGSGAVGASIRNGSIDGNAVNQINNTLGIEVDGNNVTVENISMTNMKWDAIVIANGAQKSKILNNRIYITGRYGITINGVGVSDCQIIGNSAELTNNGSYGIVGSASNVIFANNYAVNCGGDGIAGYNHGNLNIVAVGNNINSPGNHGIHLSGSGISIVGNYVTDVRNGHGLFLRNDDASLGSDVTITGNTVRGVAPGAGLRIENFQNVVLSSNSIYDVTSDACRIIDSSDVTINANTFREISDKGVRLINSTRVAIVGNTFRNVSNDCVYGTDDGAKTISQWVNISGNISTGTGLNSVTSTNRSDYWVVSGNIFAFGPVTLVNTHNVNDTNNIHG